MRVPASTYGIYKDVNSAIRKVVTQLVKNLTLNDALGQKGWLNSNDLPGLCILNGPSPLLGGIPHHHLWLPWSQIETAVSKGRLSSDREEEIFNESLESSWGTIGLLAQANQIWVYPENRRKNCLSQH